MIKPREIYRCSRLDEFRDYLSGETFTGEEYTTEAFIQRLTERQETAKMSAGTAVHKVLELASDGAIETAEQDGWNITFDLDATIELPPLREIQLSRHHYGETLFGRVDSITGTTVHDTKTTEQVDAERYADSYQWRGYLWMSGRSSFVYDILKTKVDADAMTVTITDYVKLTFHRYPELDRDVERLFARYVDTIQTLGILDVRTAAE